ncbi:MAG TPA: RNA-binding S4 domain-containing protein [Stellaceae bacterium]|nr:RNA-binding S4 domain-containing protein [Stellaceae bacterium]
MSANGYFAAEKSSRRLDQWLWFARFAKSRSLAARLCAAGEVAVNGIAVAKPNHAVKPGDVVVVQQRGWERTVRVVALGERRGPAAEARGLFEETAAARRALPQWEPLLFADDGDE